MGKILKAIAEFFASLFGRRKSVEEILGPPDDDEAVEGDLDDGLFRNRTSLTLRLERMAGLDDLTLKRGEDVAVRSFEGEEVRIVDEPSGVPLGSVTVGFAGIGPHLVVGWSSIVLEPPADPGATVIAKFRNLTPFDLEIVDDVSGARSDCPRGHTAAVHSAPKRILRAVTVASSAAQRRTAGAGDVPAALEVGRFVVGTDEILHHVDNTVIGLENTTGSPLLVAREVGDDYFELSPGEYALAANSTADEWIVVAGETILQRIPRTREALHERIDVRRFAPPPEDAYSQVVEVVNRLAIPVELHERGPNANWRTQGSLRPGEGRSVTARVGSVLRATERRTGRPVSDFPVDDPLMAERWEIRSWGEPGAGHMSRVVVANETHMTTYLVDLLSEEVTTVRPHGHVERTVPLGRLFVVCGIEPERTRGGELRVDGVIAVGRAERVQPVIRPTSDDLRGASGGRNIEVVVENLLGVPIDVVDVDEEGTSRTVATCVPADVEVRCATVTDRILRVVRHGTGEIMHESILRHSAPRVRAAIGSHPEGPPTDTLVINKTLLDIVLYPADENGARWPTHSVVIPPGRSQHLETSAGWSFFAVDQRSGHTLHAFVLQRDVPVVEVTSNHVRSTAGATTTLRLQNEAEHIVQVRRVDATGAERMFAQLRAGGGFDVDVAVGTYLRAYVSGAETLISEWIVAGDGQKWPLAIGFVRDADPDEDLHPGEVLIVPPAGSSARAKAIDRSVDSPELAHSLGLRIGHLRVGPHTIATVRCTTTSRADREIRMTMDTSLPDELAGAQVDGIQLGRLLDANELGIAQRTHLVEEYRSRHHGGDHDTDTGLATAKAYRTSLTFPPTVTAVDVSPVDEGVVLQLLHLDQTVPASSAEPARFHPNAMGKVQFSFPATDLSTPTLVVRTNTMPLGTGLEIHPDAVVHDHLARMPPGEVARRKTELGLGDDMPDEQCHQVQNVLQNLAKNVQHRHAPAPHGVNHERVIAAGKMSHEHWHLTTAGGAPSYQPLTSDQLAAAKALGDVSASTQLSPDAFGDFFAIVVHTAAKVVDDAGSTVRHVVKDVDETANRIARDVDRTGSEVVDDLRRGDVGGALTAAARGTVSVAEDAATGALRVGGDLVDGAAHLLSDVAEGAEQVAVATIRLAGEVIHLVLDTVEHVAQAIGHVLEAIGSSIEKALEFLVSLLPLGQVFDVHDAMMASLEQDVLDRRIRSFTDPIRGAVEQVFGDVRDDIETLRANSHNDLDDASMGQTARPAHHSPAQDAVDWVTSHLFHPDTSVPPPAAPHRELSDGHRAVAEAVATHPSATTMHPDVGTRLDTVIKSGVEDPTSIGPALLDIALDLAEDAVRLVEDTAIGVLDAAEHLAEGIVGATKGALPIPVIGDVYRHRAGREPTVAGIVCLLGALPAGFDPHAADLPWHDALTHVPGSPSPSAAERLPPPPEAREVTFAALYSSFQFILGVLALVPDPPSEAAEEQTSGTQIGDQWITDPNRVELTQLSSSPLEPASVVRRGSRAGAIIEYAEPLLGLFAVFASSPSALWDDHPDLPFQQTGNAVDDWPNYVGDIQWTWQLISVYVELLVAFKDAQEGARLGPSQIFSAANGVLHLIATFVLLGAESAKSGAAPAGSPYKLYGNSGGITLKTLQNLVGAVPYFMALAQAPDTPRSPTVRFFECAAIEADVALMIVRTARHGLY